MTDRQKLALIEMLFDTRKDIHAFSFTEYYSETADGECILLVEYFDSGGNKHIEGLTREGKLRTYEV